MGWPRSFVAKSNSARFVMQTKKCVLVTAGASGIGLAIASAFAAEGAKLHICDINEDAMRALTKQNPSITWTACDVSDRSAVERLIKAAMISGQMFPID